jgi:hypothetical protein
MANQVQTLVGMVNAGKIVLRAQIEKIGLTRTRMITRRPSKARLRVDILFKV